MANDDLVFKPPVGPPPLLTFEQIQHIAFHGWLPVNLTPELLQGLQDLSSAASVFFDQAPDEKKDAYPPSSGTEWGFYHVPNEKEYLTFRHHVHEESKLEDEVSKVWREAALFLYRILCDLSRAGDYDPAGWDHLVASSLDLPKDGSDMVNVISLMRLFRYYPTEGIAAEHVDIGLLTLCVGDGQGLQMLDRSKQPSEWVDAEGPVVLVGDMTRALMRNRVRAGAHRVLGNPSGRSSTVFALRPDLKHTTDLAMFGGDGVVDTKEYFYKIKGRKYNINATKDIRERQQQAQRERKNVQQEPHTSRAPGFGQG